MPLLTPLLAMMADVGPSRPSVLMMQAELALQS